MHHSSGSSLKVLLVVLVFAFAVAGPSFVGGQVGGPLHDDTGEPCLGPDDPFCSDGGSDGGGGGGSGEDCVKCSRDGANSYKCIQSSEDQDGNRCEIELVDMVLECQVEGSC